MRNAAKLQAAHNAPLDAEMLAKGCVFWKGKTHQHFKDENGNYTAYPVGYVTGPQYNDSGTPNPWCYSIYTAKGWRQCAKAEKDEADQWLIEQLRDLDSVAFQSGDGEPGEPSLRPLATCDLQGRLIEALHECITHDGATCFHAGKPGAMMMRLRLLAINETATAAIAAVAEESGGCTK